MNNGSSHQKILFTLLCILCFSSALLVSACETANQEAKRPSASFESGIFKGKKESRR